MGDRAGDGGLEAEVVSGSEHTVTEGKARCVICQAIELGHDDVESRLCQFWRVGEHRFTVERRRVSVEGLPELFELEVPGKGMLKLVESRYYLDRARALERCKLLLWEWIGRCGPLAARTKAELEK